MSGRPMRADACRNRDRLLAVAAQLFAERGIEAPLEEIAKQAGVGIGTLYRHFPTRDALIEAVYRREVEQLCDAAPALLETRPPDEALAEWMQRFVVYVANKRGLAMALKSVIAADSELFAEAHRRVRAAMGKLVDAAKAADSIRDDVEPEDLLRAISGVCLMSDQSGPPDHVCRVTRLLMDGLRYGADRPATTGSRGASSGL